MKVYKKSNAKTGKLFINKEWAKAEFDNGYKIKCTSDHKFLLKNVLTYPQFFIFFIVFNV